MASKRSSARAGDKATARKGGSTSATAKGKSPARGGRAEGSKGAAAKAGTKAEPKASGKARERSTPKAPVERPAPVRPAAAKAKASPAKAASAKAASAKAAPAKTKATKAKAKPPADQLTPAAPKGAARRGPGPLPEEPLAALPKHPTLAQPMAAESHEIVPPEPPAAGPDAPLAERTTEELWGLYRTESKRLRAEIATLETEDELDEEQELQRLEAEERAARELRARENAEGATEDSGEPEPSPEARPSERPGHANSPWLELLRNELIERHYPLVRYIAERLLQTLPKSIELDDLISAGQFGLMDAIRGFDPSRGIKFKTYCSTRIRGSILDQLRSQDWVPRLVRLKASRIDKALQRLTGEFGREPTHAELARALELEHGDLSREMLDSQAKTMFSLSEKWDDDDDGSVEKVEILEDRQAIDPVHELNRRDLMGFITRSLTHKERFIIEQYYQYGHTMREIGEMLTLTESRVCQIHSNVMGRLKNLLAQRDGSLES